MPIKINGSTSGSVTLAAPATGSDVTVTLPAAAGTIPLSASATLTTATLSDPTLTGNVVWSGATLRAGRSSIDTYQTTTSTSFTDLATAGPSVTLTTGTQALVMLQMILGNNTNGQAALAGVAVSGATTLAAANPNTIVMYYINGSVGAAGAFLLTGLTAGSNTFTVKYRTTGGTSAFENRILSVIDMGS